MKRILSLTLLILISLSVFTVFSAAESGSITVSDEAGLTSALSSVADGGRITLSGTVAVTSGFKWNEHGKTVTVTGGTLDLSAVTDMAFGDSVIFESITLILKEGGNVYANGHSLTITETVTVTNTANLYGGSKGGTVEDTELTVLSGSFYKIFGGSNGGTVNGDTNVYVGENVNANCDWTSHSSTYMIYGGGNGDNIKGNTNITVGGNAKANYIFGGSVGSNAKIGGISKLSFGGNASAMSLYGASNGVNTGNDVTLTMTGGEIQQMFGGCQSAALSKTAGDVEVKLCVLGGKISRRIYGGCYNEYKMFDGWKGSDYVTGMITLVIGSNVNISLDYSETVEKSGVTVPDVKLDDSIFARSRQSTVSNTEKSRLIFLANDQSDIGSNSAYGKYSNKTGFQGTQKILYVVDISMGMKSVSVADEIHTVWYSASDDAIVENCIGNKCSAVHTADAKLNIPINATYTGSHIVCPISYASTWMSGDICIEYSNNVYPGEATVKYSLYGFNTTRNFTIYKAYKAAPELTKTDETISGKADGKISGLDTDMEYSTNGSSYTKVTAETMTDLESGVYYVRYAESDCYKASSPVTIVINEGRKLTVTFKIDGETVKVMELDYNGSVSDSELPDIPHKEGTTGSYWEITAISNVQADIEVNAVYTEKLMQSAPVIDKQDESIAGKNDGALKSLSTMMEYSTDRISYTPVTSAILKLAPGTYYVRYAETDTKNASPAAMVVIEEGRLLQVKFVADGNVVEIKELRYGESVTELPAIPEKEGYTETAPVWSVTSITNVTEDLTVTAQYVKDAIAEEPEIPPAENDPEVPSTDEDPATPPADDSDKDATETGPLQTLPPIYCIDGSLTDKPEAEETAGGNANENNTDSGCGGAVAGGLGVIAVIALASLSLKKKEG